MADLKFTDEHEWLRVEGDTVTVGITDYAQEQLGDVVYVELPEVGKTLTKGGDGAVVESVKAASEVYAPIDGEVLAINEGLADDPARVNSEPYGGGWFFQLRPKDAGQLDGMMDEAAYKAFIADLE